MSSAKKLLIVSWTVPPALGGSAYISHQLALNFKPEEIIMLGGTDRFPGSISWYDGVRYHYACTELHWRGHGARFLFPLRLLLFPLLLWRLSRVMSNEKPDAVLATFPDGFYLLAAWMVSGWYKIPFSAYFHNSYTDNRKGFERLVAEWIQKRVFRDSQFLFTMSEGLMDHFTKHYPEVRHKFSVLPHTFNAYPDKQPISIKSNDAPPYRLILIGTLNHSNMEATRRLLECLSRHQEQYQLELYSPTDQQILKYKWKLDLEALGVRHCGHVAQEAVAGLFSTYHACILTHGFTGGYTDTEYQTIFPTRTIPLLLSGLPIFAHSPENCYLTDFIRRHDCAELVTGKEEGDILRALERVTRDEDRIRQLLKNARKTSALFYGPDVAGRLKAKLFGEQ
ncbi:MAG TPA: glycosyltransferase [Saprospiraceae bacterium]|nr:glycosyltransferase [Saprospiraceae bacterium]